MGEGLNWNVGGVCQSAKRWRIRDVAGEAYCPLVQVELLKRAGFQRPHSAALSFGRLGRLARFSILRRVWRGRGAA